MKQLYLLLFFILSTTLSFAQNWQPINSHSKLHYSSANIDSFTNTIRVIKDSVSGQDSIFTLNTIVEDCDTCIVKKLAFLYRPQFLQYTVVKKPNGVYDFIGVHDYTIKTLAELNDTWVFSSKEGINAEVVKKEEQMIFGILDSVKVIDLSSGQQIILSKNFGIIEFEEYWGNNKNYTLIGIADKAGMDYPDFWDIYNYNVGDILCYESYTYRECCRTEDYIKFEQLRIKGKTVTDTGFIYEMEINYNYNYHIIYEREAWTVDTTIVFSINDGYFASKAINELVVFDGWGEKENEYGYINSKMQLGINDSSELFLYFGGSRNEFSKDFKNYIITGDNIANDSIRELDEDFCGSHYKIFQSGLGCTSDVSACFETEYHKHLSGFVKNGDTTGTILVGLKKAIINETNVSIYPNPATSQVSIQIDGYEANAEVSIYNTSGQVVVFQHHNFSTGNLTMDVATLPKGIYYVKVESENFTANKKLIVN